MNSAQLRPPPLVFCDECTLSSIEIPAAEVQAPPGPATHPDPTPFPARAEAEAVARSLEPPEPDEAAERQEDAAVPRLQRAVEDLRDSVGRRLEEQGWVLERVLDEKLHRLVAGPLEEHRRVVEDALTARLEQRQRELVSQLAAAVGERLEQHRQGVETLLKQQLEQPAQAVVAELPSSLDDRLEQHRMAMEAIVRQLEQRPHQVVAELPSSLDDRLEQHHQALDASLAEKLERRHGQLVSQLAVALGDRLEQHRQSLETILVARLEQTGTVLTSELTAAVALVQEHSNKLITDLNDRLEERLDRLDTAGEGEELVNRLEKALVELGDGQDERLASGLRAVAELEDRLRSQQKELTARLQIIGDRAAASGTLSLALVQATGEKVVASLGGVSAQLSHLSSELYAAQQGLDRLRLQMEAVRSSVSTLAAGSARRSPAALLAGFGVAAPGLDEGDDAEYETGSPGPDAVSDDGEVEAAPVASRNRRTAKRSPTRPALTKSLASKKSASSRTAVTRVASTRGAITRGTPAKRSAVKRATAKKVAVASAGKTAAKRAVAQKSTGTRKATSERAGKAVEAKARLATARRALESGQS